MLVVTSDLSIKHHARVSCSTVISVDRWSQSNISRSVSIFNEKLMFCVMVMRRDMNLTTHILLISRLRMRGVVPPLSHRFAWRGS